jgi:asparagine synthase (glutamine-hydrolysing)
MCGLSGVFDYERRSDRAGLNRIALAMSDRLHHRGPDSGGCWADGTAGFAVAHRRLAIVDLTPEGHQPMHSASERYVLAFNGEIYNFEAIRRELAGSGCQFRGRSDSEVLLSAIEQLGLDATLKRIAGMFAFALWDRAEQRLHLVRDRIGKKPLYYGWVGRSFVFASELKALTAHPDFRPEIDRRALTAYFRHQYVPAPFTIWRDIYKLPPGTSLSLCVDDVAAATRFDPADRVTAYWSLKDIAEQGERQPLVMPDSVALDRLEAMLIQAVGERMIADVPLGAFLSGGIDSSLIVALMQQQSARPVKTFTIGFDEAHFNEANVAREVAERLGTDHSELVLSPAVARSVVPDLPDIYDEPFADPSAIPTFHVARLARTDVTVCLSGDGGDEVFAGYGRYALAARLGRGVDAVPRWLRGAVGRGIGGVPVHYWDAAFRRLSTSAPTGLRGGLSGDRMHKFAELLDVRDRDELYHALVSASRSPQDLVSSGSEPVSAFLDPAQSPALAVPVHRMMYYDSITYLPDDILVKVDRASMAVSLEARAPLLDHRVIELAWRLPPGMLRRDGGGKWPLRQLLERHLPAEIARRPKQGFGIPVAEWLREPLRDWAEALFEPNRLEEGLLDPAPIRRMWAEHLSGSRNWSGLLWSVAMYQAWRERWIERPASQISITGQTEAA